MSMRRLRMLTMVISRLQAIDLTGLRQGTELATIRAEGLAFDREESAVGVSCVAAPLFDPGGVVGAISVTGTTTQVDLDRLGPAVRTASLALSRQLGAPLASS